MVNRIEDFVKNEGIESLSRTKRIVRILIKLKPGIGIIPCHPGAPNSFRVERVHGAKNKELLCYCEGYRLDGGNGPDFRISVSGGDQGYVDVNHIRELIVLKRDETYL
jgi:hypothetical protein